MSTIHNPIAMLRQLKGAPLSVLLALSILKQPTSEQMLSRVTGYSEKVIRDAAHYLQEIDLVGRNARFSGWVILKDVFQLPLMPGDNEQLDPASGCHQDERYFLPVADASATTALNRRSKEIVFSSSSGIKESNGNIYRSLTTYEKNMINLLHFNRVGDPTAIRLIKLEHVNLIYLMSHISNRNRKNLTDALMIFKIQKNDKRPLSAWEYETACSNGNLSEVRNELKEIDDQARNEIIDWRNYYDDHGEGEILDTDDA